MSVETMRVGKGGFSRLLLKKMLVGLVMPVLVAFPAIGVADVITFEQRVIDHLDVAGAQTEGAFQYKATLGDAWEVQNTFGNPASALVTKFLGEPSVVGHIVEIKLIGGGLFRFVLVDFRSFSNDNHDSVSITGYLGGNPTGTLSLNTPTQTFQTVASGFSSSIDLLRIEVTDTGGNALILDNFTFDVPEPSTFALVLLGAFFGFLSFAWQRPAGVRARQEVASSH